MNTLITLPQVMKAFVLTGHGDFDKLEWHKNWPVPQISGREILIRVRACGLNNTDINTRTAWYSKSVATHITGGAFDEAQDGDAGWGGAEINFPRIQGADVVGMVVAIGLEADPSLLGRRVLIDTWLRNWDDPHNLDEVGYYGSECDGGFAEFTKIDERQVHPINASLSDIELASFATSYITAENMLNRAQVNEKDTIFITGASGGVGSALIQLAKRRGAMTIAYCSASKAQTVKQIGADHIIIRGDGKLNTALFDATGMHTVSVVADVVGGNEWSEFIACLQRGGRYTCAGAIAGPIVAMDLRTFYLRDLTFTGATIVPPGIFTNLVGYIERGEIKPVVAETYPLEQLHDAQRAFISKTHTGNIIVTP